MGGREAGPAYDRDRTRRALEALTRGGEAEGVRDEIVASWRRSLAHGVPRETLAAPYDERVLDPDTPLVRAADPVLEQLQADLDSSPSCVTLADQHGRILRRVTGDPRLEARLDEASAAPGFSYAERYVGTNALGTALHDRRLVVVHEREHFHDVLAGVCGSARPVRDPVTGHVLGALGIAAPARPGDASWSALVRQSALLVESRLFDLHADGQRELYAAYLAALRHGRDVFAIGPDLLRAPPEVRERLAGVVHDRLWEQVVDALATRSEAHVPVELGGRTVPVRVRALEHRGRLVGAVGELRAVEETPFLPQPSGPVLLPREYAGWSAPVRAAAVALRRLAQDNRPVCLVGETGTGKATMVERVAGVALAARPPLRLDAAAALVCPDLVAEHLASGSPVVVRHAEALDPATVEDLVRRSAHPSAGRGWLALTWRGDPASPGTGDPALPGTSSGPAVRVLTLPPLRSRPADVGRAVDELLRTRSGGRHVTFTPTLVERLRRQPWPTNLTGVTEVVDQLLARREGPVVDVAALDEVFQAAVRRRLTPVEWLLRAAIVDALRAHAGNKDLAAASLGMSRASIYRKIKSLDIDVASLVRE